MYSNGIYKLDNIHWIISCSKTMKNNNKTNKVSTTERGAGQLKSGLDHRNPVKTGSDSGVGSGQNSLSSSAGSSPMSPVILTANSPDMRSPGHFSTSGNGKRPEHFGSVIGHSSPSKKLKVRSWYIFSRWYGNRARACNIVLLRATCSLKWSTVLDLQCVRDSDWTKWYDYFRITFDHFWSMWYFFSVAGI